MYYIGKIELIHQVETDDGIKEKKTKEQYLVEAGSVCEADHKIRAVLDKDELTYDIASVSLTKIVKVLE